MTSTTKRVPLLEVCIDNYESMLTAARVGVPRLEVCSSLMDGGLTPSRAMVVQFGEFEASSGAGHMSLYIMIRPRGGDFCYSNDEIQIMAKDIEAFKQFDCVDGFVFGCLLPDGTIDEKANQRLIQAASPKPCTFHRAFDMVASPTAALEQLITLGFVRLLTSGQRPTAQAGSQMIATLIAQANNRIIVMPGAGITPDNAQQVLAQTGAIEFHSSASAIKRSPMCSDIEFGSQAGSGVNYKVCCPLKAKQLLDIAKSFAA